MHKATKIFNNILRKVARFFILIYRWFTATKRRKILAIVLIVSTVLGSIQIYFLLNPRSAKAATLALTTSATEIQIDVANRYRMIMNKADTEDYMVFYDRYQNASSPSATHEFRGPCIFETNTYCLRDDAYRVTTILEATATRIKIRVEGKFNYERDYLSDRRGRNRASLSRYTIYNKYINIYRTIYIYI